MPGAVRKPQPDGLTGLPAWSCSWPESQIRTVALTGSGACGVTLALLPSGAALTSAATGAPPTCSWTVAADRPLIGSEKVIVAPLLAETISAPRRGVPAALGATRSATTPQRFSATRLSSRRGRHGRAQVESVAVTRSR